MEERAALSGWLVALSEPQCRGAGLWVGEEGAPSPPRATQGQSPCLCLASPCPITLLFWCQLHSRLRFGSPERECLVLRRNRSAWQGTQNVPFDYNVSTK